MPYSEGQIRDEIRSIIRENIAAGNAVPKPWITETIMKRHPALYGDDLPWALCCMYRGIDHFVRDVLRTMEPTIEEVLRGDPVDEMFPGFDKHLKLQPAYIVERNEVSVVMPIHKMTRDERYTRAAHYESMGDGLYRHAKALREYEPPQSGAA